MDYLEKLKERLYKRKETFEERQGREKIHEEKMPSPPPYWQVPPVQKMSKSIKKIFTALVILLIILVALALYFLLSGTNLISSRNINIEIKGPSYVEGGELTTLNVFVENKNKSALELAELIFNFPENTFSAAGEPLDRVRFSLGKIEPGGITNKSVETAFFGLENEEREIIATLEYRLADSNAIFAKDKKYTVKISRPPMGISISLPKEINSKQELNIKVETVSNSNLTAKNIFLQMGYPSGFQFISAEPMPTSGNNNWSLGDIGPQQKRTILVKGIIEGQDFEQKAISASVGVLDENGTLKPFGAASEILTIKRSALNFSIYINGKDIEDNVARAKDSIRVNLQWLNNTPQIIRDVKIELELKGNAYNEQTISVNNGFYRTFDKKIVWNPSSHSKLLSIKPGESGDAQFSFSILESLPIQNPNDKNFYVRLEANISGFVTTETGENMKIFNDASSDIKIASNLKLTATCLYHTGLFENSGPMPPRVGEETTYTIIWSLGGNSNDFSNVKVSASLPAYVRWLNNFSPVDSEIKFNERDGTVVWNVGDVLAGVGIVSDKKEVAFQISFAPNLAQVDSTPVLISETNLESYDNFIKDILNLRAPALDINLKDDPQFRSGEARVIK